MVYLYPKTIQTSTGRSSKHGTQQLSNPQALCSNDTRLAYWGVKSPTWMGNYMRNWPDSLTSYSGSYNKPEVFYATGFEFNNVSSKAKLTGLTVEYKWEQISYSCGTADCFGQFQKPSISVMLGDETLATLQGAEPESNRYNNNKVNQAKINTDNAELVTLHSHSFNLASYNLTVGDLKNIKIKFNSAQNTSTNHLRVVMQFIRIKLSANDYKIDPLCRIKSSIDKDEATIRDTFIYTTSMYSSNGQFDITNCKINIPSDIEIINIAHDSNGNFNKNNGLWTVNRLDNSSADISFTCRSRVIGKKTISANLLNNADSINYKTTNNIDIISKSVAFDLKVNENLFKAKLSSELEIEISLVRSQKAKQVEKITIDTDGLLTERSQWAPDNINMKYIGNGKWEINNITYTKMVLKGYADMTTVGDYTIKAIHQESNEETITKEEKLTVIGEPLSKEYFKFKIQDGADVQYNSLTFTEGDDLINPLTYEIEDDNTLLDNLVIVGETRTLPIGEAKYIKFDMYLDTEKDLKFTNILANINANNGEEPVDIVLGGDDLTFFESANNKKYFVIDEINSQETKTLSFIVQSDIEQMCEIKIIIFNEDKYNEPYTKWKPSYAIFKDIPSIKLSITGTTNDLMIDDINNGEFTLYYTIQNKSEVYTGKNLKFKIEEPIEFKELSYEQNDDSTFNQNTRIWKFNELKDNQKHTLAIRYKATKKGIYDFILHTLDDKNTYDDDQYNNSFTYHMMVNINSITDIETSVSKSNPYIKELFDFNINVKNYIKKQKNFNFEIRDIGQYDLLHDNVDYTIEYIKNSHGIFKPNTDKDNNILGTWTIDKIDINEECDLTLTLKPTSIGTHVIRTIFTDNEKNEQHFDDKVRILESNHKVSFDVVHAVYEGEEECPSCDDLIPICDEDFINLKDDIYYLFKVTNNESGTINNLTAYARIPYEITQIRKEDNNILHNIVCYPHNDNINMRIDENTGLINFNIKKISKCQTATFCIKISPDEDGFTPGEYISYFGLTMRNARVKTKQLFLTIDNTYTEKKLEHEITIYNFEKTHRYFRYEIDGTGNLFKFYNKGDRTLRSIHVNDYDVNKLETYKGTNLRQLYRDIKSHSKYVQPELLRIGSNAFEDMGYELYPDGFMRRFGLLNSEIFHYTGQLPQSSNLVDYVMKWDVDDWDTKMWAGGLYQNGVFDISVDYNKVPTNFNILEPETNPIKTLQSLVDRTKPFGTKGIAYYSSTTELDLNVDMDIDNFTINSINNFDIEIEPVFGLVSWYNRHDNSIAMYNDVTKCELGIESDFNANYIAKNNQVQIKPMVNCIATQYDTVYNKKDIKDCTDIIQQIYNHNSNVYGISILKPITNNYTEINDVIFNQTIELYYPITQEEEVILTNNSDTDLIIKYTHDQLNNFTGFRYYNNDKLINEINFNEEIYDSYIRIEYITDKDNNKIFHFWCTINNKDFYHLGYYINKDVTDLRANHTVYKVNKEQNIYFKINDTNNIIKVKHNNIHDLGKTNKWNYLNRINSNKQQYAYFENNAEIDRECSDRFLDIPHLMLQYNGLPINNSDEITNIGVKINAHSNKETFLEDININLFKNGQYYMPINNIRTDMSYPQKIKNVYHIDNTPVLRLQIKGITICSNCLKTSLGYYDECPHCKSDQVTHFEEQQEATICYNCGWVHNGWYDKCNHCLSKDVEKVMVDVNQTYCNTCKTYSDDYYPACPKCFSNDIVHTHNNDIIIEILNDDTQNIEPIDIKSNIKRINIFNIKVPLDTVIKTSKDLEHMILSLDINNNYDGEYYYCKDCGKSGFGHYETCPHCYSSDIENYNHNNIELQCYIKYGTSVQKIYFNEDGALLYGKNNKTINLLDCIKDVKYDTFTLIFYVENLDYDNQYEEFLNLVIDDEDDEELIDSLLSKQKIDITVNNLSIDSKNTNEVEWENIDEFYGKNHQPLIYKLPIGKQNSNIAEFKDFNFTTIKDLSDAYLYIHGLNKSNSTVDLTINVIDKNKDSHPHTIENILNGFFTEKILISKIIPMYLFENVTIQLQFKNIKDGGEILINDLYILTEKNNQNNIYHDMHQEDIDIYYEDDEHIFNNNMLWHLNDTIPYYLDGNQVKNGLLCYIDFGQLNTEEYIRVYNIELLITYKNKKGKFITDYFPISMDKNEKMISGDVVSNSSEVLIETKSSDISLSNLEYDIFNNTHDEDTLSAMPLRQKICQSFIATDETINQIDLQYFGHVGYPNNHITLKLFDNYNNSPNNLIASYNVVINTNVKKVISFEIDADVSPNDMYWIVLEDESADKNNYHRFRYNKNVDKGILITQDGNTINKEGNYALSYAIYSGVNVSQDYTLPTSFAIEKSDDAKWYHYQFKNYYTLYRYNINTNSNISLNNLCVKYGYQQEWK